jgi:hypothetical protein
MDFWPDFVIIGKTEAKHWTKRSSQEMQRRMKRLIWNTDDGNTPPEGMPIHGVVSHGH